MILYECVWLLKGGFRYRSDRRAHLPLVSRHSSPVVLGRAGAPGSWPPATTETNFRTSGILQIEILSSINRKPLQDLDWNKDDDKITDLRGIIDAERRVMIYKSFSRSKVHHVPPAALISRSRTFRPNYSIIIASARRRRTLAVGRRRCCDTHAPL